MGSLFEWERNFDGQRILRQFAKGRTVKGKAVDGKNVSFDAGAYEYWLPVLCSAIRANREAAPLKLRSIRHALSDPTSNLNDAADFLSKCENAFTMAKSSTQHQYFVLCSITYIGPPLTDPIYDGDCVLRWQSSWASKRVKKALAARAAISSLLATCEVSDNHDDMTPIIVDVRAGSPHEAYDKAMYTVDRFRGLLNLIVNSGRRQNIFSSLYQAPPHAINRLRLGPCQTVHLKSGALATEVVWYEPRWSHKATTVKFSPPPAKVRKDIRKWWKRATSGPLKEHVGEGLIRYCYALDNHDRDATLVRLWGAIEHLTITARARYDTTVSRLMRIFNDSDDVKQIAEHIRAQRNSTIHAGNSPDEQLAQTVIDQAEMLCRRALNFCISRPSAIKSTQDLTDFLDLSLELSSLDR